MIYTIFLIPLLLVTSATAFFAQKTVANGKVTDAKTALLSCVTVAFISSSIGIENIFKFIRADLVKKIYYSDNSNVAEWGIRTRVDFNF